MTDEGDEAPKRAGPGAGKLTPAPGHAAVRRYTDEEVAGLIRRALQLQDSSREVGTGPSGGLTLAEIRQVAAEVGIDPRFIELAASEESGQEEPAPSVLAGAPYRWRFRRSLPGEVPEEERARILQAIREVMGAKGEVTDLYGRMEWSHDDSLGPVIVGVDSRDGSTEVDVSASRGGEVGLWHGLTGPFAAVLTAAVMKGSFGVEGGEALAAAVVAGGLGYLGSRTFWKYQSARWSRRLRRLAERVSEAASRVALAPPAEGGDEE